LTRSPPIDDKGENPAHAGLLDLAEVFPVFPSPRGCNTQGAKALFVQTIDRIARKMGTRRPKSRPLDPSISSPPHGWVLKREFSDAGRHVYIPVHPLKTGEKPEKAEVRRAVKFLKEAGARDGKKLGWLAQEYVPTIASVGELRFMCVGGNPVRVVITNKHPKGHRLAGETCSVEGIKTMLSLEGIQFVFQPPFLLTSSHELHRSLVKRGGTVNEATVFEPNQTARSSKIVIGALERFVKDFLRYLVEGEGPDSSFRVFCRVDVGIFVAETGEVSYFVNEVESGITTSLWVADGQYTAGQVGMTIAEPLKGWIAAEQARIRVRAQQIVF
jgi:hypothetical protein